MPELSLEHEPLAAQVLPVIVPISEAGTSSVIDDSLVTPAAQDQTLEHLVADTRLRHKRCRTLLLCLVGVGATVGPVVVLTHRPG